MNIKLRKATAKDAQIIFDLIYELAVYEKAPEKVTNSVEAILNDGFGANAAFEVILAENENEVLGMAFYYPTYSTWRGKMMHLEDLIVREKFRRLGIGDKLMTAFFEEAKKQNAKIVKWEVLDWNTPAIEFYKQYKTNFDEEWIACKLYEGEF